MEGVTVEPATGPYGLGEGPHWDHRTQKLYFVDIFNQKIYSLDPATDTVTSAYVENGPIGVAIPVQGMANKFLTGTGTDLALITWNCNSNVAKATTRILSTVDTDKIGTRWNDGKVDSAGRFWGGTMGAEKDGNVKPDQGTLYSVRGDLVPKKEVSPVTISNGLAWSIEDDMFYYIDSMSYQVVGYKYDPSSGAISDKKVVFDLKKNNIPGFPDGMTIDTDGNLWVAVFFGGRVIQINPKTGKLLRSVTIPAERVTSVAFGCTNLEVLYVTTSCHGLTESEMKEQPLAGYVFAVKGLGVRGLEANLFKM